MRLVIQTCMLAFLMLSPLHLMAQGTATLVADNVRIAPGGTTLEAIGNVQVFYDGTTLSAAAIVFNQTTDSLTISGPIFIRSPDGTVLSAEQASLDPRLENGVLRSARVVLNQQLQLATSRIDRVDGRYLQLARTVATSCNVCNGRAPLWEIRASRVVHDQVERQIYFDNASLHIRGFPIFWVPQMRLPDPTLSRTSGLLIPSIRSNDVLGVGIKLPYFFRIGDSRDLTLTPYISVNSRTLEGRYRQAFLNGTLEINAAISRDDVLPESSRGYLFAEGRFDVGREFQLAFDVEATSDRAYLLDYGFSDKDRLDSAISLLRVRDNDLFIANLTYFDSLRDDESDSALPPLVANLAYERRYLPQAVGGILTLGVSADAFERTNDLPGDTGRDLTRVGVNANWNRQWLLPVGLVLNTEADLAVDYFDVRQDPAFESGFRSIPAAGATLRWPLARQTADGTRHVLEPVISVGWSQPNGITPPNEDSTLAEYDEGNLLGLTRFPGQDARENGTHTAVALSWTRYGADGVTSVLTFGRLYQDQPQTGFSPTSGLSQQDTDWLVSAHFQTDTGLTIDARALFDDAFEFDKTEARLSWITDRVDLTATYHWLPSDINRNRPEPSSEWSFDAGYQYNDQWRFNLSGQYDVATDTPRRAGLGVEWRNECVTVDLSASRRYTTFDTVEPTTDYGFSVSLSGFSTGRSTPVPAGSCYD